MLEEIVPPLRSDSVPEETVRVAAPRSLNVMPEPIPLEPPAPCLVKAPSFWNVPPAGLPPLLATKVSSAVNLKLPAARLSNERPAGEEESAGEPARGAALEQCGAGVVEGALVEEHCVRGVVGRPAQDQPAVGVGRPGSRHRPARPRRLARDVERVDSGERSKRDVQRGCRRRRPAAVRFRTRPADDGRARDVVGAAHIGRAAGEAHNTAAGPLIPEETANVPPPKSSVPPVATWTALLDEIVPPPCSDNVPEETVKVAAPKSLNVMPEPIPLEPLAPSLVIAPSFRKVPPAGMPPLLATKVSSAVNVKLPAARLSNSAPLERKSRLVNAARGAALEQCGAGVVEGAPVEEHCVRGVVGRPAQDQPAVGVGRPGARHRPARPRRLARDVERVDAGERSDRDVQRGCRRRRRRRR